MSKWQFTALWLWIAGVQFMVGGLVIAALSETRCGMGIVMVLAGGVAQCFASRALDNDKRSGESESSGDSA